MSPTSKPKSKKKWIQSAIQRKGGLHKSLGIPMSQKVGISREKVAAKKKGRVGRQARLALTLRRMKNKRSKSKS